MRIEVGKEIEFARNRLNDIIYLAEQSRPVDQSDWEGYTRSLRNLIASQAHQAMTALATRS